MNQASPVAVVTGVGPGTGAAIVRRFARGGYAVAMLARNHERLAALEREITRARAYPCDVTDEVQLDTTLEAIRAELGSAVKFARVAEGAVDIYPRLGPTSEWDVAAGHAVVTAAGGKVTDSGGAELQFGLGQENFIVPEFIAWGDPSAAAF